MARGDRLSRRYEAREGWRNAGDPPSRILSARCRYVQTSRSSRASRACAARSRSHSVASSAPTWTPATGLALFWVESLALALVAVALAFLVRWDERRRTKRGRESGEGAEPGTGARRREIAAANIDPGGIFAFHVGSLFAFGAFLGGVLFMLSQRSEGIFVDRTALAWGGAAIVGFVVIGAAGELLGFRRLPAADIAARVDACTSRWAMFWMLGFFGPVLVAIFGRPALFFAFFGGLKALWEIGRFAGRHQPPEARKAIYRSRPSM